MKNNTYSVFRLALAIVLFVIGVCIFVYPMVNEQLIESSQQLQIENFRNIKSNISQKQKTSDDSEADTHDYSADNSNSPIQHASNELKKAMLQYNDRLYQDEQSGLQDVWSYEQSGFNLYAYGLNNDAAAELRIPSMNVDLPVYLGASNANMARGAAQLGETSMPIGGENTNCVIAGHRGASGGRFFLDIENVRIGDYVFLDNLWETLTYKVEKIDVIAPTDIDKIKIQDGKDMLTLITCHPYPTNYKRYVVYCERTDNISESEIQNIISSGQTVDYDNDAAEVTENENNIVSSKFMIALDRSSYVIVPILLIALSMFILLYKHRKHKRKWSMKEQNGKHPKF